MNILIKCYRIGFCKKQALYLLQYVMHDYSNEITLKKVKYKIV